MESNELGVQPSTAPRIRIVSYAQYVEETETGIREILYEHQLSSVSTFTQGEPF